MYPGPQPQQEPIGALLARLIEDGRALAKAELALFRTDFYRRLGRARMGALLCLVGAIMGQAAAVAFLVTLSFVLTPWIGRLGGSAVSVTLGVVLAVVLIRLGIRKLLLVIEDPDDEDVDGAAEPARRSPVDDLFDRVRSRSQAARVRLAETMDEAQARLHPTALIADLVDEVADQAQMLMHRAVDAARQRPVRTGAALVAMLLLLIRPPLGRIIAGATRATRRGAASLKTSKAEQAKSNEEEKE